jgi:hypothetical protein
MTFALDQRGPVEFRRENHAVRVYDQLKLVSFRKDAISNYINNFNTKNGHGAQAWWHMAVRLSGIDAASGREGVLAGGEPIASPASLSPEAFNQAKRGFGLLTDTSLGGKAREPHPELRRGPSCAGLPRPQASTYLRKGEADSTILARSLPLLLFITQ